MATMNQPQQSGWTQAQIEQYYQQQQAAGQTGTSTAAAAGQTGYYDTTGQYHQYDYSAYYSQPGDTKTHSANAAAAVAQAAIQQAQAVKTLGKHQEDVQAQAVQHLQKKSSSTDKTADTYTPQPGVPDAQGIYPKYAVPDVSTYQFEEKSGYYYDPSTTLYYDANSQYYYNSHTSQFLYWDGDHQTYLPAPADSQMAGGATNAAQNAGPGMGAIDQGGSKIKPDKKEKVKIAKKIAKDMEKWAKSLNAQKEAMRDFKQAAANATKRAGDRESAAADAGFTILEKKSVMDIQLQQQQFLPKDEKRVMPPPPAPNRGGTGGGALVAGYGGDSESEEDDEAAAGGMSEESLVDYSKMACLLCKRQFPSKDALQRHCQLSDLHKKNLEEFRQAKSASQLQYRDRAKERRQKYGAPEPPLPRKKKDGGGTATAVPFEEPTKHGIGDDNIGNKLLQKMGWNSGQGLGRTNQGRTDIVTTQRRTMQAGLGSRGSTYNVEGAATYKDAVKKTMMARFQEMNE